MSRVVCISLLLMSLGISKGRSDCVPEFTDECFLEVQKDLDKIVDNQKNVLLNGSNAALDDLCTSLRDALKCCGDIIDTDCEVDPRKDNMDGWIRAFEMAYNHACIDHWQDLKKILSLTPCWSMERFLDCVRNEANLTKVEALFFTPLDSPEECRLLEASFRDCAIKATVDSCREEDYPEPRQRLMDLFMDEAVCSAQSLSSTLLLVLLAMVIINES